MGHGARYQKLRCVGFGCDDCLKGQACSPGHKLKLLGSVRDACRRPEVSKQDAGEMKNRSAPSANLRGKRRVYNMFTYIPMFRRIFLDDPTALKMQDYRCSATAICQHGLDSHGDSCRFDYADTRVAWPSGVDMGFTSTKGLADAALKAMRLTSRAMNDFAAIMKLLRPFAQGAFQECHKNHSVAKILLRALTATQNVMQIRLKLGHDKLAFCLTLCPACERSFNDQRDVPR
jgi:hypothetical protein